jgi:hypothetical protein
MNSRYALEQGKKHGATFKCFSSRSIPRGCLLPADCLYTPTALYFFMFPFSLSVMESQNGY